MNTLTITTLVIGILIFAFATFSLVLFDYIYKAYNPKKKKKMNIENGFTNEEKEWFYNEEIRKIVNIKSYDNYFLYGNIYENEKNKPWIIIIHGYCSSGVRMSHIGKQYYEKGYNVLIIEQRAHNISEGKYITFGHNEKYDLIYWINYINKTYKNDNPKIILHGLSMGAATMLESLGNTKNLPTNIICAIEDCGYSSFSKELLCFIQKIIKSKNISNFILCDINILTKLILKFSIYDVTPMTSISKITIPILFIHGEKDDFVPFEMVYENYNNAKCKKELLLFDSAIHARCYLANKELYWNGIWNFIDKHKDKDKDKD